MVPAVSGARFEVGGVSCYVAGEGPPLRLLHSVNAAAPSTPLTPPPEHYRAKRTVFAPELPGCAYSPRINRAHSPCPMTDGLHAVVLLKPQRPWHVMVFATGALPRVEMPGAFCTACDTFPASPAPP